MYNITPMDSRRSPSPSTSDSNDVQKRRINAAMTVQRAWRSYRTSSLMDPKSRWDDALLHAKLRAQRSAADQGKNDPLSRWKRGTLLAGRLRESSSLTNDDAFVDSEAVKTLEVQHWLELTDSTDMAQTYYHGRWKAEDTEDNFFKWLDRGGGKDLSLEECPREKLDSERIVYLSPEQRLNYLVKADDKGLLRWAQNGELVDTVDALWQDSGDGNGVVPSNGAEMKPETRRRTSFEMSPVNETPGEIKISSPSLSSNKDAIESQRHSFARWIKKNVTPTGVVRKFLKKTIKKDTWIYVADKHLNLYIGIKDTGTFQHSSFLSGGQVASAGLISVRQGLIHQLSPLSGHYRTRVDSFRRFVQLLQEKGVDMHRAEISRGEIALWGVERINQAKKSKAAIKEKKNELVASVKDKASDEAESREVNKEVDEADGQWKREILQGRKRTSATASEALRHDSE